MSNILPNRDGLKALSDFNIDAQFVQKYGSNIFGYSGEVSPEYQSMCQTLQAVIADLTADLDKIKSNIPVFSGKNAANQ